MNAAVVGVVGSLLGVALGFGGQYLQHRLQRQELLKDAKRKAYTEYLRAVDASYAEARAGQTERSEDPKIGAVVAEIELLSKQDISIDVRQHSNEVIRVHGRLARGEISERSKEISDADGWRQRLIESFKLDLGIGIDKGLRASWRRWRHWGHPAAG